MITKFKKTRKNRLSISTFFITLVLIITLGVIGFLLVSNIKISKKRTELNNQIAAIEKQIDEAQNKNENLKEGIAKVEDEEYIEKVAREELNLQKQGEKVVAFILPQDQADKKDFWHPQNWWQWIKQWIKSRF